MHETHSNTFYMGSRVNRHSLFLIPCKSYTKSTVQSFSTLYINDIFIFTA